MNLGRGWNLGWTSRPAKEYGLIAATGAKLVRVGFVMESKDGASYELRPEVLQQMAQQAASARARGMRMVLAVFTLPNPDRASALWNSTQLQSSYIAIWERLARALIRYRNVSFDLLNEPSHQTWPSLASQAIEAIRKIDPPRKIVYEPSPGSVPDAYASAEPLPYKNIVYSVHMYERHEYTHQKVLAEFDKTVNYQPGQIKYYLTHARNFQFKHKVPMYVGEFSAVRWAPGREQWLAEAIEAFTDYGWSWTYHGWREWDGWDAEKGADANDGSRNKAEPAYQRLLASM